LADDSWASSLFLIVAVWLLVIHFVSCAFHFCAEFESLGDSWVSIHGLADRVPSKDACLE
jgi:hypothetical protein